MVLMVALPLSALIPVPVLLMLLPIRMAVRLVLHLTMA